MPLGLRTKTRDPYQSTPRPPIHTNRLSIWPFALITTKPLAGLSYTYHSYQWLKRKSVYFKSRAFLWAPLGAFWALWVFFGSHLGPLELLGVLMIILLFYVFLALAITFGTLFRHQHGANDKPHQLRCFFFQIFRSVSCVWAIQPHFQANFKPKGGGARRCQFHTSRLNVSHFLPTVF